MANSGLFIISAPSGSGKSTLVRELFRLVPRLRFSISYTTRPPRGSEQNGKEYFFVTRERFEEMIREDAFLEWAEVFGNYYGTAWAFLEQARQQGDDLVLDIDVQGAELVRRRLCDAIGIFISPPDRRTLESRLRNRGQDTPEVIERRLQDATREIAAYNKYDYVLVNDQLEDAVEQLSAIVVTERARLRETEICEDPIEAARMRSLAESCRSSRMEERLRPVLQSFGVVSPHPASKY